MKITKIREVKTPTRGTECSAGLDFYVPQGFTARLTSGTDILVPSGIRAEVPHGDKGQHCSICVGAKADSSQPSSRTRRGRVQGNKGDIIGTLLTGEENAVVEPKASVHPLSHKMEFKGARSLTSESPTLRATESKAVSQNYRPSSPNPWGQPSRPPDLTTSTATRSHIASEGSFRASVSV